MRIAYLADRTVNGWYRASGPMSMLASRGHTVVPVTMDRKSQSVGVLQGADVLHIHRYADADTVRLVREARARGVAVVWDDDDNIGALPRGTTAHNRYGGHAWERRLASLRRIFPDVDLVTAPSSALAEVLERQGAQQTMVIENYVPSLFLEHQTTSTPGITIGWVASGEHQIDVERVPFVAALQRLLDERPDVRVSTIGLRLGLRSPRYESTKHVPHIESVSVNEANGRGGAPPRLAQATRGRRDVALRVLVPGGLANHTAAFDIGIAPLADIAFNTSRSNIKLKEYAAGGTPWLASPVGPYHGLGERQGGRLVPDERWYEELLELIDKPRALRKLAKHATKWVQDETLEKNVHRWEQAFEQAMGHSRGADGPRS
jgi:glycosyltransferase involved in cell wall biosynthesis